MLFHTYEKFYIQGLTRLGFMMGESPPLRLFNVKKAQASIMLVSGIVADLPDIFIFLPLFPQYIGNLAIIFLCC